MIFNELRIIGVINEVRWGGNICGGARNMKKHKHMMALFQAQKQAKHYMKLCGIKKQTKKTKKKIQKQNYKR